MDDNLCSCTIDPMTAKLIEVFQTLPPREQMLVLTFAKSLAK